MSFLNRYRAAAVHDIGTFGIGGCDAPGQSQVKENTTLELGLTLEDACGWAVGHAVSTAKHAETATSAPLRMLITPGIQTTRTVPCILLPCMEQK